MSQLRVSCFSLSLDGFAAGPEQSRENPLGIHGPEIHDWQFDTATFQQYVLGKEGGETGIDDDFVARGFENVGAWIMGRNMFGPVRGHWPDDSWKGWWGDTPPFQAPVFVLTHHARDPIEMLGGTTFYFVNEGIHAAWRAPGRPQATGMCASAVGWQRSSNI
ncbi:dihydrofolate reductase family protein [Halomonas sp. BC04]|uniref:dihydrofolate reductase family protein n=1 Tax=Halomonas sp. BC04 TaxID=1403540 RepID=UPI0003ED5BE7|nr:dihydrofolate reductase family protein [Halomonas sp. BC04]EWH01713.1 deaminase reductase [Halomonas sp. BC04]